jgi:hypothetical protein
VCNFIKEANTIVGFEALHTEAGMVIFILSRTKTNSIRIVQLNYTTQTANFTV